MLHLGPMAPPPSELLHHRAQLPGQKPLQSPDWVKRPMPSRKNCPGEITLLNLLKTETVSSKSLRVL